MGMMKTGGKKKARQKDREELLRGVLRAAEQGKRDKVLALLSDIDLRDDDTAPLDERWLSAERIYLEGKYEEAVDQFQELERDRRYSELKPWQRFLSLHRRAFASFQVGHYEACDRFLARAEKLCRSTEPLAARYCDIVALRAHLAELLDDFESARALLQVAHELAVKHKAWRRAITTASDLARISGIVGKPSEGLTSVKVARHFLEKHPNPSVERTLRLREGMLYVLLGQEREALHLFNALIEETAEADDAHQLLIDVLGRRADLFQLQGRYTDAERDLRRALVLADQYGLPRHAAYLEADYSTLCLENPEPKEAEAAQHFRQALHLLETLQPPPRRLLRQLAEMVVEQPALIGRRRLPSAIASELVPTLDELRRLSQTSIYQRARRIHRTTICYERLRQVLLTNIGPPIRLQSGAELQLELGKVWGPNKKVATVPRAQMRVLRILLAHCEDGITVNEIAGELGDYPQAVQKNIERLRKILGPDLQTEGAGRSQRVHKLLLARTDSD
jgi:tetratricopeptide (TPR) repeat protein